MSSTVTFNGQSYVVPAIADASWGSNVSNYLIAISTGCLQKTGGAFTLTADANFGATYGIVLPYLKSVTTNVAAAGVVRLAKTDVMSWRNNANGADLALGINGSDALIYNSIAIADASSAQTFTNKLFSDSTCKFANVSDATKLLMFSLGGATTAKTMTITSSHTNNRTLTLPDVTDTLAAIAATQTLTNKTLDNTNAATLKVGNFTLQDGTDVTKQIQFVASGINTGTTRSYTLFNSSDTLMGLTFQQTVINKFFKCGGNVAFVDDTDTTKQIQFQASGATTAKGLTLATAHTNNRTITFPDVTDTLAAIAATQNLTNKTLDNTNTITAKVGNFTLQDGSDVTKQIRFVASSITTGTTRSYTWPDSSDTVALLAATQAFTNKDYQGGTASNTSRLTVPNASTATLSGLTRKQATIVYDTTLNQLYSDDGSNLNPVGSGAGEKNYISTGSNNAGGWTASGGGITLATDTTAADLPRPNTTKSGILLSRVSGSTAYGYYRFTLDNADYNKKLKIVFAMKPGGSFVASDFKIDMYSNTASDYSGSSTRLALSTDSSAVSALPNMTGVFQCAVDMPGSSAPYMELRVGLNAGTSGTTLAISDVIVGPGIQPQGAVVGYWSSWTPTGSWSSNVTYTGKFRQIGSLMELIATVTCSGAPTSAALTINMPTGYTIDSSSLPNSTSYTSALGTVMVLDSGVKGWAGGTVCNGSSTSILQLYHPSGGGDGSITQAAPITFGASDSVSIHCFIPISEWSGAGIVNLVQNDVEYVSNSSTADSADTTSFVYGPAGSAVPGTLTASRKKRVSFNAPIQATDTLLIEIQPGGAGSWIPLSFQDNTDNVAPFSVQNAKTYGMGLVPVTATTVDVIFGQYSAPTGSTFDSAGTAWGSVTASTRYRIRKLAGGQAVGFGNASQNSAGLVRGAGQLIGTNTNDAAAVGYVGERIVASSSSLSNFPSSGTYGDMGSIVLTAGDWDISLVVTINANSATFTSWVAGIGTVAGNDGTGLVPGDNKFEGGTGFPNTNDNQTGVIPAWQVSLSATTTYYAKLTGTFSVATPKYYYRISARRVR